MTRSSTPSPRRSTASSIAAKRAGLYKQAQQILIDRGPVIVPFFETAAAGASAKVQGIELAPDWSRTLFRTAYLLR